MQEQIKQAAAHHAHTLAEHDRQAGAPQRDVQLTSSVSYASFIEGASWAFAHAPVNWEQRRYEIAREVLASLARSSCGPQYECFSFRAVAFADALIAELNKTPYVQE